MKQYAITALYIIVGTYCFISGVVFYGDYIHPHVKALIMPEAIPVQLIKMEIDK